MINVFAGYDAREAIGWHVFASSLIRRASKRVALHFLDSCGMQQGSNEFTMSRFLVPHIMGYQGRAIFMDGADMLMMGDIAELDALFDPAFAVQVVKHDYVTRNPVKYLYTELQCPNRHYARKNWASVMLFNCAHPAWAGMHPAWVAQQKYLDLLQFKGIDAIGDLPRAWNVLADEGQPVDNAKVLHWTAGIPGFQHYANAPGAEHWHAERRIIGL